MGQPKKTAQPQTGANRAGAAPATTRQARIDAAVAGGLAGGIALVVYLATLSPTLPPGDSGDLITAAATLGVAHPPGYPLFAIVGHLFSLLPVGSIAYRVNLMSAVMDAAAVGTVAVFIHRLATEQGTKVAPIPTPSIRWMAIAAGLIGGLALAFATQFWTYSLVAEVFALNNLFAALLLLLAVLWYQNPLRRWPLWGLALASGLAFSNHQTIVLLAPALGLLVIGGIARRRRAGGAWRRRTGRDLVVAVGLALIGLLTYLYLPIAAAGGSPALWGDPSTLERFLAVVTRADYGSFSLVAGGRQGSVVGNLGAYAADAVESLGLVGCALVVLGVWWLARNRPVPGLALVLAWAATGPLFLIFASPPLGGLLSGIFARFYILPTVPAAVVLGCGAFQLLIWARSIVARRGASPSARAAIAATAAVALLVAFAIPAVGRAPAVDQSKNFMTQNFVQDLLGPLEPNAILLTEGDTAVLGTWYAQNVEGVRPDVTVIAVPLLRFQWYVDELRRRHPDITIPFEANEVIGQPVTDKVVDANVDRHPMYYVGVIPEDFPSGYAELRTGFARKFVPFETPFDPFAFVRDNLSTLGAYRFPDRSFPTTSWENWEAQYYSGAAFDLANAYETIDVRTAERLYRTAISLGPGLPASYKNLAILLSGSNGAPGEIADLLEHYLVLAPNDPEAARIRAEIQRLRSGG